MMSSRIDAYDKMELFKGYPMVLLYLATAFCIVFMLIGIPGNILTIAALFKCKKVRNATAVFIINLSVSDLMFCCFNLPLAASTFLNRSWKHGKLLCQLYPLLRYGLLAVSLFTVLAITINRYVMIGHPDLYPKLYSDKYLFLMVISTWVCGFGALVATWLKKWGQFGLDPNVGSCSILPDENGHSPKQFLFLTAFVIPCLCIVICYARIFYIVRKTALKSRINVRSTDSRASIASSSKSYYHYRKTKYEFKHSRSKFSADDSVIGVSSCGPSYTTEKTTENTQCQSEVLRDVTLQVVTPLAPSPNLLLPPSTALYRSKTSVILDHSSSSGIDVTASNEDDASSPRSATPTSTSSSRPTTPSYLKHRQQQPRKKRLSSINLKVWHVAGAIFRRSSFLKTSISPRRSSQVIIPGKMTAKDRKLLKMILVIFASFVICYLPITISKTSQIFDDLYYLHVGGYILIYFTTCINPIIYVVMSSEYRQAYKNLLFCRGSSESQQNQNIGGNRKYSQKT